MSSEFEMSMVGELNYFLGLQVKQFDKGIFITQNKYAKNLVKRFGLDNKKHMKTPMGTNDKLSKDENGTPIDPTLYRSMIGSLLYLTASRPNISYSVCVCARYQSCPKESHLKVVKRIIRYINGTTKLGILYSSDINTNLAGFSDVDWAGDVDDRKSTTGGCFYLGNNLVSWKLKLQKCMALSTTEAEYIAVMEACKEMLWLKKFLQELDLMQEKYTLYCDSQSAIHLSKNSSFHSRSKHIDVRYHWIRDVFNEKFMQLDKVHTDENGVDMLSKSLSRDKFEVCRSKTRFVDFPHEVEWENC
ncbi:hypothetical protein DH2020_038139 [Rehmannia glutinosa]|uniref:Uncharacterized protein n=1 Tax=Rehmannia glutinosa TaxID=99300 RepID=A0ABR0UZE8_REHGL